MEKGIEKRAPFDLIRYANCWEDADTLLSALKPEVGKRYLSIASSGDNTFAILSRLPSLVLAVDLSQAQIACAELRKAAFLNLSYEQVLEFLGVREGKFYRESTYRVLRKGLSWESRDFWDHHPDLIRRGIIHVGKFESYFALFRRWVLPLIHNGKKVKELLKDKTEPERKAFYEKKWNTWLWQLFFRIFFSRTVMGRLGRDPEFFRYVEQDVAARILERAQYALTVLPTYENPYLEYILTGNFRNSLPLYLRRDRFKFIRQNLDKLVLFRGDLGRALETYGDLRFHGCNLSDIFEYMSDPEYEAELERIIGACEPGARLVYWNMLAERSCPPSFADRIRSLHEEAKELFSEDKAFFYKALIVEEVR
ncbi:MAG: DUF3419 family protein [Armatimonadetes bacterium]|nr:DUF3419 family protein [Armatimonadota bacterium]